MLSPNPTLVNRDNTITTSTAIVKTNGVYILLNLDTSVSVCAFLSLASSTNSSILATVESLNSVVAFIYIIFPILLLLGIGSGFRSVYMVTKSFYASDKKKENEKLQYMEDLKNYRKTHPDEDFSDVMEGKKKRYPERKA